MDQKKKIHPKEKLDLHPRNRHRKRYDFKKLTADTPALLAYVHLNKFNDESIDFSDSNAVMMLNKALLKHHYSLEYWEIPAGYLCPPIPGRAEYIHHIADLLGRLNEGNIPVGLKIRVLDIGLGANCIYPIIGSKDYKWSFVGTDIDPLSINTAKTIIEKNAFLKEHIEVRLQSSQKHIFKGVFLDEHFDLTICNPPFHASAEEARSGNIRKIKNIKSKSITKPSLNFGGQNTELWCEGGEVHFVNQMIAESKQYADKCLYFTTLISKQSNLKSVYHSLKDVKANEVKTIKLAHGNKISRIVAWTFLTKEQQKYWTATKWK